MNIETTFPTTNAELAKMLGTRNEIRFPSTFDDFWNLLEVAEYNVEYYEHETIATMSYETDLHSNLATQISFLLKNIFCKQPAFAVRNGNRPVCIPDCGFAVFNPDGSVVAKPGKQYEYRPGMTAELNPILLFEVLSKSTRAHDLNEKLPCYKKIPSMRQILLIEQHQVGVTLWERIEEGSPWLETEFVSPDDVFVVYGKPVSLREVYEDTLI